MAKARTSDIGKRINSFVNVLWKIILTITILTIILSTFISYAYASHSSKMSGKASLITFVIATISGGFFLFICYGIKLFLEGYVILIDKTQSIESMLWEFQKEKYAEDNIRNARQEIESQK